jgi:hypothetical protein
MAGRRSGWISWDAIADEAEEDAGELNYDYEWIVSEPGSSLILCFAHSFSQYVHDEMYMFYHDEEEGENSDQRRGGRLGLAGGVRPPSGAIGTMVSAPQGLLTG